MKPAKFMADLSPRAFRRAMNLYPALRATGARVTHISDDWRHWRLKMRRTWRNWNYVGTIFGGSLYAGADPHYMLAWMHILGPDYIVWDKAAAIRFRKPGRSTLVGGFTIAEEEVEDVRRRLETEASIDRTYPFAWTDRDGVVHVEIEKTLYFRKKGAKG